MNARLLVPMLLISACLATSGAGAGLGDGLVAHYSFTDGSLIDESGRGNSCEDTTQVQPTADRCGFPSSALRFDGIDDFLDCGNNPTLDRRSLVSRRLAEGRENKCPSHRQAGCTRSRLEHLHNR